MGLLIALWESLSSRLMAVQNLPPVRSSRPEGIQGLLASLFRMSLRLIAFDKEREREEEERERKRERE